MRITIAILILSFVCGCGDNPPAPPVQPTGATTIQEIRWVEIPTQFNIAVPNVNTHGNTKKAGYAVTGQLINNKGKPIKLKGVSVICIASVPNCDPLKESGGIQNIFVFEPSGNRTAPVKSPPGVGVFEGQKMQPDCCYIQVTKQTDENGQFAISFFVEADTFYEWNSVKMSVSCTIFKDNGKVKRGLSWYAVVPSPNYVSGQSIFLFSRNSALTDVLPTPDPKQVLLDVICVVVLNQLLMAEAMSVSECECGTSDPFPDIDDFDSDGVSDCRDFCPDNPLMWEKSAFCTCWDVVDSDGDGTPDCADVCPDNSLIARENICGCDTLDSDGDGNFDCIDLCPGENDFTDNDGDGIPNCLDECPNDPLRSNCVDRDWDGDVDDDDLHEWEQCATSPGSQVSPDCLWADLNGDEAADQTDFAIIQRSLTK